MEAVRPEAPQQRAIVSIIIIINYNYVIIYDHYN